MRCKLFLFWRNLNSIGGFFFCFFSPENT
jgi:hypothetical protein